MTKRPGRKPKDPRRFDCKLQFDTPEDGQALRQAGGGPFVKRAVLAALGRLPPDRPITAAATPGPDDTVDVHVHIPREHLKP